MIEIIAAASPEHYAAFGELVSEYAAWLAGFHAEDAWFINAVLKSQSLDRELRELPAAYGPPHGRVLLAADGSEIAGGVAYRRHAAGVCEMKRMFVRDGFRGLRLGRRLCEAVLAAATADGYGLILLDTSRKLTPAIALYESFGFRACAPYRQYPEELLPHLLFMEKPLKAAQ